MDDQSIKESLLLGNFRSAEGLTATRGPDAVEHPQEFYSECLRRLFEDYLYLLDLASRAIHNQKPDLSASEATCRAVRYLGAYVLKDAKRIWKHLIPIYGRPDPSHAPIRWNQPNQYGNVVTACLLNNAPRIKQEWQEFAKSVKQLDALKTLLQYRMALVPWTSENVLEDRVTISSTIMSIFVQTELCS